MATETEPKGLARLRIEADPCAELREATAAAEQRLDGLREALRGLVDAHRLGREHRPCMCAAHEDARRALLDPAPELVARTEEMLAALRGPASPRQGEPVDLDVAAFGSRVIVVAHHMLRGGYLASEAVALSEARNLVLAAWTGERWDVDPEWRSPEQNAFLDALSTDPAEPVAPDKEGDG